MRIVAVEATARDSPPVPAPPSIAPAGTVLLVGASRGLGHAMAGELLRRGWHVVGTVRGRARTLLHDLADEFPRRVEIEILDICASDQLAALRERLSGRTLDMLFVNAGTTNPQPTQTIGEVSTEDFVQLMITNALSPMRVIESLQHLVPPTGLIGVMSSGQGSIGNNVTGLRELYRGTKAALNIVHAQLRGPPGRDLARDGSDGAGLGPHRPGRTGSTLGHRGQRAEPGGRPAGEADAARPGISRLSRPHGALVTRNLGASAPLRRSTSQAAQP